MSSTCRWNVNGAPCGLPSMVIAKGEGYCDAHYPGGAMEEKTMPDESKFAALRAIGYRALPACGLCVHFEGKRGAWGHCRGLSYKHAKHGMKRLGVHAYGSCERFSRDDLRAAQMMQSYADLDGSGGRVSLQELLRLPRTKPQKREHDMMKNIAKFVDYMATLDDDERAAVAKKVLAVARKRGGRTQEFFEIVLAKWDDKEKPSS